MFGAGLVAAVPPNLGHKVVATHPGYSRFKVIGVRADLIFPIL
jgi:hypothetical protein